MHGIADRADDGDDEGASRVTQLGWMRSLRIVGVDVTKVRYAAGSQCNRARTLEPSDTTIMCIGDRQWLRKFTAACVQRKAPDLVYVASDGALVAVAKCSASLRAKAQAQLGAPIPAGYW